MPDTFAARLAALVDDATTAGESADAIANALLQQHDRVLPARTPDRTGAGDHTDAHDYSGRTTRLR